MTATASAAAAGSITTWREDTARSRQPTATAMAEVLCENQVFFIAGKLVGSLQKLESCVTIDRGLTQWGSIPQRLGQDYKGD